MRTSGEARIVNRFKVEPWKLHYPKSTNSIPDVTGEAEMEKSKIALSYSN